MGKLVAFPGAQARVATPDQVRVSFDFGRWCVDFLHDHRMLKREPYPDEAHARQEAARQCVENGLRLVADMLPPPTIYGPEGEGASE